MVWKTVIMFTVSQEFQCFLWMCSLCLAVVLKNAVSLSADCSSCLAFAICAVLLVFLLHICICLIPSGSYLEDDWNNSQFSIHCMLSLGSEPKVLHYIDGWASTLTLTHAHIHLTPQVHSSLQSRCGDYSHRTALMQCRWIKCLHDQ